MSFITVMKKIGNGIKVAAVTVAHGFTALFGSDASKQFAEASLAILKSAIGHIVTKIVDEMATSDLTSTEKREQAVVQVLALAAQEGIQVAESEVRLLIEVAVQFVKGKITVTTASAPAAPPA